MASLAARAKVAAHERGFGYEMPEPDPFASIPDAVAPRKAATRAETPASGFESLAFAKKAIGASDHNVGQPVKAKAKQRDFKGRTDTHMRRLGYQHSYKVETWNPFTQNKQDFLGCDYLYYGAAGFALVQVTSHGNRANRRTKMQKWKKGHADWKACGGKVLLLTFGESSKPGFEEWQ